MPQCFSGRRRREAHSGILRASDPLGYGNRRVSEARERSLVHALEDFGADVISPEACPLERSPT
jgi:hypothetical protein